MLSAVVLVGAQVEIRRLFQLASENSAQVNAQSRAATTLTPPQALTREQFGAVTTAICDLPIYATGTRCDVAALCVACPDTSASR